MESISGSVAPTMAGSDTDDFRQLLGQAKRLTLNLARESDRIVAAKWIRKFETAASACNPAVDPSVPKHCLELLLVSLQNETLVGAFKYLPEDHADLIAMTSIHTSDIAGLIGTPSTFNAEPKSMPDLGHVGIVAAASSSPSAQYFCTFQPGQTSGQWNLRPRSVLCEAYEPHTIDATSSAPRLASARPDYSDLTIDGDSMASELNRSHRHHVGRLSAGMDDRPAWEGPLGPEQKTPEKPKPVDQFAHLHGEAKAKRIPKHLQARLGGGVKKAFEGKPVEEEPPVVAPKKKPPPRKRPTTASSTTAIKTTTTKTTTTTTVVTGGRKAVTATASKTSTTTARRQPSAPAIGGRKAIGATASKTSTTAAAKKQPSAPPVEAPRSPTPKPASPPRPEVVAPPPDEDDDEILDHSFLAQMKAMVNVLPETEPEPQPQPEPLAQPTSPTAAQKPSPRDFPNVLNYTDMSATVPLLQQFELASDRFQELFGLKTKEARDEKAQLRKQMDDICDQLYMRTFAHLKIQARGAFLRLAQHAKCLVEMRNTIVEAIHLPTRGPGAQIHQRMCDHIRGLLRSFKSLRTNQTPETLHSMDAMTKELGLQDLFVDVAAEDIVELFRRKRAGPPELWSPAAKAIEQLEDRRYRALRMPDLSGRIVYAVAGTEQEMQRLLEHRHAQFNECVLATAERLVAQNNARKLAQFMQQPLPQYELIDPLQLCGQRLPPELLQEEEQQDRPDTGPYVEVPLEDGTDRTVWALRGTEEAMLVMLRRNAALTQCAVDVAEQVSSQLRAAEEARNAGRQPPQFSDLDPVRICAQRELNDDRYVPVVLHDGSGRIVYAVRGTEADLAAQCRQQRRNTQFNACLAAAGEKLRKVSRVRTIANKPLSDYPVVDAMAECQALAGEVFDELEDEEPPLIEDEDDEQDEYEQPPDVQLTVNIGVDVERQQPVVLQTIRGYGGDLDIRRAYGYRRQQVPNTRSYFYYAPSEETAVQATMAANDVAAMHVRLWLSLELACQLDNAIRQVLNGHVYRPELRCTQFADAQQMMGDMSGANREALLRMLLLQCEHRFRAGFLRSEQLGEGLDAFVDAPRVGGREYPIDYGLIYGYGGQMDIREVFSYVPLPVRGTNAVVYCEFGQIDDTLGWLQGDTFSVALLLTWSQQLAVDLDRSVQQSMRGGRFTFVLTKLDDVLPACERILRRPGGYEALVAEASHKYRAGERMLLDDGQVTQHRPPRRSEGAQLAMKGREGPGDGYRALPARPDWEQAQLQAHIEWVERRMQYEDGVDEEEADKKKDGPPPKGPPRRKGPRKYKRLPDYTNELQVSDLAVSVPLLDQYRKLSADLRKAIKASPSKEPGKNFEKEATINQMRGALGRMEAQICGAVFANLATRCEQLAAVDDQKLCHRYATALAELRAGLMACFDIDPKHVNKLKPLFAEMAGHLRRLRSAHDATKDESPVGQLYTAMAVQIGFEDLLDDDPPRILEVFRYRQQTQAKQGPPPSQQPTKPKPKPKKKPAPKKRKEEPIEHKDKMLMFDMIENVPLCKRHTEGQLEIEQLDPGAVAAKRQLREEQAELEEEIFDNVFKNVRWLERLNEQQQRLVLGYATELIKMRNVLVHAIQVPAENEEEARPLLKQLAEHLKAMGATHKTLRDRITRDTLYRMHETMWMDVVLLQERPSRIVEMYRNRVVQVPQAFKLVQAAPPADAEQADRADQPPAAAPEVKAAEEETDDEDMFEVLEVYTELEAIIADNARHLPDPDAEQQRRQQVQKAKQALRDHDAMFPRLWRETHTAADVAPDDVVLDHMALKARLALNERPKLDPVAERERKQTVAKLKRLLTVNHLRYPHIWRQVWPAPVALVDEYRRMEAEVASYMATDEEKAAARQRIEQLQREYPRVWSQVHPQEAIAKAEHRERVRDAAGQMKRKADLRGKREERQRRLQELFDRAADSPEAMAELERQIKEDQELKDFEDAEEATAGEAKREIAAKKMEAQREAAKRRAMRKKQDQIHHVKEIELDDRMIVEAYERIRDEYQQHLDENFEDFAENERAAMENIARLERMATNKELAKELRQERQALGVADQWEAENQRAMEEFDRMERQDDQQFSDAIDRMVGIERTEQERQKALELRGERRALRAAEMFEQEQAEYWPRGIELEERMLEEFNRAHERTFAELAEMDREDFGEAYDDAMRNAEEMRAKKDKFEKAALDALEHYERYGLLEGIDPNVPLGALLEDGFEVFPQWPPLGTAEPLADDELAEAFAEPIPVFGPQPEPLPITGPKPKPLSLLGLEQGQEQEELLPEYFPYESEPFPVYGPEQPVEEMARARADEMRQKRREWRDVHAAEAQLQPVYGPEPASEIESESEPEPTPEPEEWMPEDFADESAEFPVYGPGELPMEERVRARDDAARQMRREWRDVHAAEAQRQPIYGPEPEPEPYGPAPEPLYRPVHRRLHLPTPEPQEPAAGIPAEPVEWLPEYFPDESAEFPVYGPEQLPAAERARERADQMKQKRREWRDVHAAEAPLQPVYGPEPRPEPDFLPQYFADESAEFPLYGPELPAAERARERTDKVKQQRREWGDAYTAEALRQAISGPQPQPEFEEPEYGPQRDPTPAPEPHPPFYGPDEEPVPHGPYTEPEPIIGPEVPPYMAAIAEYDPFGGERYFPEVLARPRDWDEPIEMHKQQMEKERMEREAREQMAEQMELQLEADADISLEAFDRAEEQDRAARSRWDYEDERRDELAKHEAEIALLAEDAAAAKEQRRREKAHRVEGERFEAVAKARRLQQAEDEEARTGPHLPVPCDVKYLNALVERLMQIRKEHGKWLQTLDQMQEHLNAAELATFHLIGGAQYVAEKHPHHKNWLVILKGLIGLVNRRRPEEQARRLAEGTRIEGELMGPHLPPTYDAEALDALVQRLQQIGQHYVQRIESLSSLQQHLDDVQVATFREIGGEQYVGDAMVQRMKWRDILEGLILLAQRCKEDEQARRRIEGPKRLRKSAEPKPPPYNAKYLEALVARLKEIRQRYGKRIQSMQELEQHLNASDLATLSLMGGAEYVSNALMKQQAWPTILEGLIQLATSQGYELQQEEEPMGPHLPPPNYLKNLRSLVQRLEEIRDQYEDRIDSIETLLQLLNAGQLSAFDLMDGEEYVRGEATIKRLTWPATFDGLIDLAKRRTYEELTRQKTLQRQDKAKLGRAPAAQPAVKVIKDLKALIVRLKEVRLQYGNRITMMDTFGDPPSAANRNKSLEEHLTGEELAVLDLFDGRNYARDATRRGLDWRAILKELINKAKKRKEAEQARHDEQTQKIGRRKASRRAAETAEMAEERRQKRHRRLEAKRLAADAKPIHSRFVQSDIVRDLQALLVRLVEVRDHDVVQIKAIESLRGGTKAAFDRIGGMEYLADAVMQGFDWPTIVDYLIELTEQNLAEEQRKQRAADVAQEEQQDDTIVMGPHLPPPAELYGSALMHAIHSLEHDGMQKMVHRLLQLRGQHDHQISAMQTHLGVVQRHVLDYTQLWRLYENLPMDVQQFLGQLAALLVKLRVAINRPPSLHQQHEINAEIGTYLRELNFMMTLNPELNILTSMVRHAGFEGLVSGTTADQLVQLYRENREKDVNIGAEPVPMDVRTIYRTEVDQMADSVEAYRRLRQLSHPSTQEDDDELQQVKRRCLDACLPSFMYVQLPAEKLAVVADYAACVIDLRDYVLQALDKHSTAQIHHTPVYPPIDECLRQLTSLSAQHTDADVAFALRELAAAVRFDGLLRADMTPARLVEHFECAEIESTREWTGYEEMQRRYWQFVVDRARDEREERAETLAEERRAVEAAVDEKRRARGMPMDVKRREWAKVHAAEAQRQQMYGPPTRDEEMRMKRREWRRAYEVEAQRQPIYGPEEEPEFRWQEYGPERAPEQLPEYGPDPMYGPELEPEPEMESLPMWFTQPPVGVIQSNSPRAAKAMPPMKWGGEGLSDAYARQVQVFDEQVDWQRQLIQARQTPPPRKQRKARGLHGSDVARRSLRQQQQQPQEQEEPEEQPQEEEVLLFMPPTPTKYQRRPQVRALNVTQPEDIRQELADILAAKWQELLDEKRAAAQPLPQTPGRGPEPTTPVRSPPIRAAPGALGASPPIRPAPSALGASPPIRPAPGALGASPPIRPAPGALGASPPIRPAPPGAFGASPPIRPAPPGAFGGSPPIRPAPPGAFGGSPPIRPAPPGASIYGEMPPEEPADPAAEAAPPAARRPRPLQRKTTASTDKYWLKPPAKKAPAKARATAATRPTPAPTSEAAEQATPGAMPASPPLRPATAAAAMASPPLRPAPGALAASPPLRPASPGEAARATTPIRPVSPGAAARATTPIRPASPGAAMASPPIRPAPPATAGGSPPLRSGKPSIYGVMSPQEPAPSVFDEDPAAPTAEAAPAAAPKPRTLKKKTSTEKYWLKPPAIKTKARAPMASRAAPAAPSAPAEQAEPSTPAEQAAPAPAAAMGSPPLRPAPGALAASPPLRQASPSAAARATTPIRPASPGEAARATTPIRPVSPGAAARATTPIRPASPGAAMASPPIRPAPPATAGGSPPLRSGKPSIYGVMSPQEPAPSVFDEDPAAPTAEAAPAAAPKPRTLKKKTSTEKYWLKPPAIKTKARAPMASRAAPSAPAEPATPGAQAAPAPAAVTASPPLRPAPAAAMASPPLRPAPGALAASPPLRPASPPLRPASPPLRQASPPRQQPSPPRQQASPAAAAMASPPLRPTPAPTMASPPIRPAPSATAGGSPPLRSATASIYGDIPPQEPAAPVADAAPAAAPAAPRARTVKKKTSTENYWSKPPAIKPRTRGATKEASAAPSAAAAPQAEPATPAAQAAQAAPAAPAPAAVQASPPLPTARGAVQASPPLPTARRATMASPPLPSARGPVPASPPLSSARGAVQASPPLPSARGPVPASPPLPSARGPVPASPPLPSARGTAPASPPLPTARGPVPASPPLRRAPPQATPPAAATMQQQQLQPPPQEAPAFHVGDFVNKQIHPGFTTSDENVVTTMNTYFNSEVVVEQQVTGATGAALPGFLDEEWPAEFEMELDAIEPPLETDRSPMRVKSPPPPSRAAPVTKPAAAAPSSSAAAPKRTAKTDVERIRERLAAVQQQRTGVQAQQPSEQAPSAGKPKGAVSLSSVKSSVAPSQAAGKAPPPSAAPKTRNDEIKDQLTKLRTQFNQEQSGIVAPAEAPATSAASVAAPPARPGAADDIKSRMAKLKAMQQGAGAAPAAEVAAAKTATATGDIKDRFAKLMAKQGGEAPPAAPPPAAVTKSVAKSSSKPALSVDALEAKLKTMKRGSKEHTATYAQILAQRKKLNEDLVQQAISSYQQSQSMKKGGPPLRGQRR